MHHLYTHSIGGLSAHITHCCKAGLWSMGTCQGLLSAAVGGACGWGMWTGHVGVSIVTCMQAPCKCLQWSIQPAHLYAMKANKWVGGYCNILHICRNVAQFLTLCTCMLDMYCVCTVYALTFAGLNFHGSQILAIFAFLFLRMQGHSLWFVYSSFSLNPRRIDVINYFSGVLSCISSWPSESLPFLYFMMQSSNKHRLVARLV